MNSYAVPIVGLILLFWLKVKTIYFTLPFDTLLHFYWLGAVTDLMKWCITYFIFKGNLMESANGPQKYYNVVVFLHGNYTCN